MHLMQRLHRRVDCPARQHHGIWDREGAAHDISGTDIVSETRAQQKTLSRFIHVPCQGSQRPLGLVHGQKLRRALLPQLVQVLADLALLPLGSEEAVSVDDKGVDDHRDAPGEKEPLEEPVLA
jgi:hypothetical protein